MSRVCGDDVVWDVLCRPYRLCCGGLVYVGEIYTGLYVGLDRDVTFI